MEPDTKKWLIVGIILAIVVIGIVVATMFIRNDFQATGKLAACEPCTPGCACDADNALVQDSGSGGP